VFGLMLLGVVAVACSGSDAANNGDGVVITPLSPTLPAQTPGNGATSASPTSAPAATATPAADPLTGFHFPLSGGCLPRGDQLMPNAPRPYRNGIHEGIDFYEVDNCTSIGRGTPVLAAKAGRVIRADLDYVDITAAEVQAYMANPNTDEALDKFRGRQVWVQHEGGIITRYAHLSAVAQGVFVGATVTQGQLVAYVGNSGTPESLTNPAGEHHLHFEVRVGEGYLGKGQPPAEVRRLYSLLFAQ
jgi:murein DD-endopeptidase MepM/ murein hydrolase activator NlpD